MGEGGPVGGGKVSGPTSTGDVTLLCLGTRGSGEPPGSPFYISVRPYTGGPPRSLDGPV